MRRYASTRVIPTETLITDRVVMADLPPVAPTTGTAVSTRLGRDYYVAMASSAYLVHPEAIGRMITVTAALDRVRAHCGDRRWPIMKGSGVQHD